MASHDCRTAVGSSNLHLVVGIQTALKLNKALAGQNHDLGINLNNNCPKGIHS